MSGMRRTHRAEDGKADGMSYGRAQAGRYRRTELISPMSLALSFSKKSVSSDDMELKGRYTRRPSSVIGSVRLQELRTYV